jgi:hypothetical protein
MPDRRDPDRDIGSAALEGGILIGQLHEDGEHLAP